MQIGAKRHILRSCILIALLSLSHDRSKASARKPYAGSIEVPVLGRIHSTDPAQVETYSEWLIASHLHETLFELGSGGELTPRLAQDVPDVAPDQTQMIIKLRPALRFHDGSTITARDVVSSWQRLLSPKTKSAHWWLLAGIQGAVDYHRGKRVRVSGLEVVNKLTLRVRSVLGAKMLLHAMSAIPTAITSNRRNKKEADLEDRIEHIVGAGPFFLLAGADAKLLTLKPFLAHPDGRPYLEQVNFRSYRSSREEALAFELGRLDLTMQAMSKPDQSKTQVVQGPMNRLVSLVLNKQRLSEKTEGFMQAVVDAVDRQSLAEYLVGKRGIAIDELLVHDRYEENRSRLSGQPQKAKSYFEKLALRRMGIPEVLEFIVQKDDPLQRAAAERIQVNLVDVGVSVFVVPLDRLEFGKRLLSGKYDFYLDQRLPLVRDLDLQFVQTYAQIEGAEALQTLLQWMAGIPNNENRDGIVIERSRGYQHRIHRIPLFLYSQQIFLRSGLRDLIVGPSGVIDLSNVWLAK